MSDNNFQDVGDFHDKFNLDHAGRGVGPRKTPRELMQFRLNFLREELMELEMAYVNHNDAGVADALVDLVYVAMGTAHVLGLPWRELWDDVQRANMSKVRATRAEDSTRGSTYDVVKPEGWQPPRVKEILTRHGWNFPCKVNLCPACQTEGSQFCAVHQHEESQ